MSNTNVFRQQHITLPDGKGGRVELFVDPLSGVSIVTEGSSSLSGTPDPTIARCVSPALIDASNAGSQEERPGCLLGLLATINHLSRR